MKFPIIQAITEAFPLSSSLHLKLSGCAEITLMHLFTGLAGAIFVLFNLRQARKYIAPALKACKELKITHLFLNSFILLALLYSKQHISPGIANEIGLFCCITSAIFMYIVDSAAESRGGFSLTGKQINLCLIANLAAVLPGVSRLGTVYTCLRITGLNREDSVRFSTIQGIIINFMGVFTHMSDLVYIINKPALAFAAALYYVCLLYLFAANDRQLRYIIAGSAVYRILVLPVIFYLFAGFSR